MPVQRGSRRLRAGLAEHLTGLVSSHHFCNQAVKPAKPGLKMVLQQGRTEAKVIFHAKFSAGYYEHIFFLQQTPCQVL